jgi:hypothetical protein
VGRSFLVRIKLDLLDPGEVVEAIPEAEFRRKVRVA